MKKEKDQKELGILVIIKQNNNSYFFKKDCAFEADYDWLKPLKEKYGLKTGLVDRDGKPVDK